MEWVWMDKKPWASNSKTYQGQAGSTRFAATSYSKILRGHTESNSESSRNFFSQSGKERTESRVGKMGATGRSRGEEVWSKHCVWNSQRNEGKCWGRVLFIYFFVLLDFCSYFCLFVGAKKTGISCSSTKNPKCLLWWGRDLSFSRTKCPKKRRPRGRRWP